MRALLTTVSVVLAGLSFTLLNACVAEEAQDGAAVVKPDLAEQIRGEWVIYRDTPNGRYMTIKKHLGHQTEVTTYDPGNTAIHSHRSEYQLDVSGTAPIFRYRNREVLVGPDAGTRDDREVAYIFRIDGDQFFEVHGMLPGDAGKPSLLVWQRLRNNPLTKPGT